MNCENYLNLLDDLLEGELDAQTAEQVNSHIFACNDCESEFEMLKREKEMFAHYLFDVEPPTNLSAQFQAKLAAENPKNFAILTPTSIISNWKSKLFGSLAFYPAAAFGIALVAFGIWWNFQSKSDDSAQNKPKNIESVNQNPKNFDEKAAEIPLPEKVKDAVKVPQIKEKNVENKFLTKAKPIENRVKSIAVKTIQKQQITISQRFKADSEIAKLSEEEKLQIKQMQALEIETAKQMEKVEMLLRSFRNARFVEGSDQFDVSYEKQQARKLLEKNIQLRERAENYGTLFTEQILSRVEPYLLDIANLDNNPLPEQVTAIKERVKNQSIIASLQSY